ncbi:MAG: prepilin-type N-terminal cleavage/methylation domain-containing protein [Chloroflexi bacterium]|nr:prepilin-type N-terminal cleavage/methylation domain-containing protein [Chloroflexota bacterium]
MKLFNLVKRIAKRSDGFTLVEALIAVGILTLGLGLVGSTVFQSLAIERFWRDDVIATKELRHADSRFAGDALYTEATSLVDGAAPVNTVDLTWTDTDGVSHTAVYSVTGDNRFVRDLGGTQSTLARDVVQTGFSLNGRLLTFDLEVEADQGTTKTSSLQTYLRALQ